MLLCGRLVHKLCVAVQSSSLSSRFDGRGVRVFHADQPSPVKRVPVESSFFQSYIDRLESQSRQKDESTNVSSNERLSSLKKSVALASRMLRTNTSCALTEITKSVQDVSDSELVFLVTILAGVFGCSPFVKPLSRANEETLREFAKMLSTRFGSVQHWNDQHDLLKAIMLAVEVNRLSSDFSLSVAASSVLRLEISYLLRLVYFFMKRREIPEPLMGPLETAIADRLDKFSLDDLALIAISFFKSKRPIRSLDIVRCMAERLCSQLSKDYVADVSVAAILKQLRYVERGEFWIYLRRITQNFAQLPLDKFTLVNWVHLAYWCTKLCFFDKQFAAALFEKYLSSRDHLRAKDAAVVFHYFTLLNYPEIGSDASDRVDALLLDQFRSKDILSSCERFPEVLSTALRCAAMRNKYPTDLVELIFSREFLDRYSQKRRHYFPLSDIFFLDCSIAIDRPECNDHRLNMADFFAVMASHENIGRHPLEEVQRSSKYSKVCSSLIPTLCAELHCSQSDMYFGPVLPHFTAPDLLLSFSARKICRATVPLELKSYSFEELQVPAGETRVVLLLCHNNRCRLFTTTWLGHVEARKRHLLRLGYNVVELNGHQLDRAPMNPSLTRRLMEVLNNFNEESARGIAVRLF